MTPRAVTRGETIPPLSVTVDWCGFTYFPPGENWRQDLATVLHEFFGVDGWERKGGWQGYEHSARAGDVIVAWGGTSQRASVHVEVPGGTCAQCSDWPGLAMWLSGVSARLTRVDIAGDDYFGKSISVDWAVQQYREGGFSFTGRPSSARLVDDLGSQAGRTLYVGKRENGKLARVYEKGKQLGDKLSAWVRFEVEWRGKNRTLDPSMLSRPAEFLAGAYPCTSLFGAVRARVRTFKLSAAITYQRMVANARQQCGRAVNAILQVVQGDIGEVVALLQRSGLPKRVSAHEIFALTGAT